MTEVTGPLVYAPVVCPLPRLNVVTELQETHTAAQAHKNTLAENLQHLSSQLSNLSPSVGITN